MKITKHAKCRGQQRGIDEALMILIVAFGRPSPAKGGAVRYQIDKYGILKLERVLREGLQLLDRIRGKQVIFSEDSEEIITCYPSGSLH